MAPFDEDWRSVRDDTLFLRKGLYLIITFLNTIGFATIHVVVSVDILSLIDLLTPYQPPKYIKDSYWILVISEIHCIKQNFW